MKTPLSITGHAFLLAFLALNTLTRFSLLAALDGGVLAAAVVAAAFALASMLHFNILRLSLFLLASSLPLYVNLSFHAQNCMFEFLLSLMAAAFCVGDFVDVRRGQAAPPDAGTDAEAEPRRHPRNKLFMLLTLFAVLALLSLLQVNISGVVQTIKLNGVLSVCRQACYAPPGDCLYCYAAVNRLLLFIAFVWLVSRHRRARELYKPLFVGLLSGTVLFSIIGILEYYNLIDLDWYRDRDITGRLVSVCGNPGWYAEYVTTTIPFILIGFMTRKTRLALKIALFGILIICEVAIILAAARTGWLVYPFTLLCCWLFFYITRGGGARINKALIVKVLISVPITLAISVFVVVKLFDMNQKVKAAREAKSGGSQRAPTVVDAREEEIKWRLANVFLPVVRLCNIKEGLAVWRERPLYGLGWESYRWHAGIMETVPDSNFQRHRQFDTQWDTPHDLYVMILDGVGLVGLALWGLIAAYSVVLLAFSLLAGKDMLALPVILSIYSFHQYGLAQDPPYIPAIWFLIFLSFGYAALVPPDIIPRKIDSFFGKLSVGFLALVCIGCVVYAFNIDSGGIAGKYGMASYSADPDAKAYRGFYPPENWNGVEMRWTARRAQCRLAAGKEYSQTAVCAHNDVSELNPMFLKIYCGGAVVAERVFTKTGPVVVKFAVPSGQEPAWITYEASRTWNPYHAGIKSRDTRELGVAVSKPACLP